MVLWIHGAVTAFSTALRSRGVAVGDVAPELLRAAGEAVASYGLRRTSLSDVAARAGVSRATVYRAFGDRDRMLRAVGRHELAQVLDAFRAEAEDAADAHAVLDLFVRHSFRWIDEHPILVRAVRDEPDLLVRVLIEQPESPSSLAYATEQVAAVLDRLGVAEQFALPLVNVAEALVRTSMSLVLLPTTTFASHEDVVRALASGVVSSGKRVLHREQ